MNELTVQELALILIKEFPMTSKIMLPILKEDGSDIVGAVPCSGVRLLSGGKVLLEFVREDDPQKEGGTDVSSLPIEALSQVFTHLNSSLQDEIKELPDSERVALDKAARLYPILAKAHSHRKGKSKDVEKEVKDVSKG